VPGIRLKIYTGCGRRFLELISFTLIQNREHRFSQHQRVRRRATGALPFHGDTSGVIFHAILERAPTPPVRLKSEIPAKLEEIINKCLEKDRDLRFQSATDLRTDLKYSGGTIRF